MIFKVNCVITWRHDNSLTRPFADKLHAALVVPSSVFICRQTMSFQNMKNSAEADGERAYRGKREGIIFICIIM